MKKIMKVFFFAYFCNEAFKRLINSCETLDRTVFFFQTTVIGSTICGDNGRKTKY